MGLKGKIFALTLGGATGSLFWMRNYSLLETNHENTLFLIENLKIAALEKNMISDSQFNQISLYNNKKDSLKERRLLCQAVNNDSVVPAYFFNMYKEYFLKCYNDYFSWLYSERRVETFKAFIKNKFI